MTYSWSKISLENYAAIDALNRHIPTDYLQHGVSLLSLATGESEAHFMELPLSKLQKQIIELTEFLQKEIREKLYRKFRCGGRQFRLVCISMDEIKGKHIEAVSILKITPENLASNCPKIMASITEEYNLFFRKPLSFDRKVELFSKHLPASIGMGTCLFFWHVSNALQPVMVSYLQKQNQKLKEMIHQN